MARDPKKLQQAMKAQMSKPASETARPVEREQRKEAAPEKPKVSELKKDIFRAGEDYFSNMRKLVYKTGIKKQHLIVEAINLLFKKYGKPEIKVE